MKSACGMLAISDVIEVGWPAINRDRGSITAYSSPTNILDSSQNLLPAPNRVYLLHRGTRIGTSRCPLLKRR
jgi:hypothetical protein